MWFTLPINLKSSGLVLFALLNLVLNADVRR